jgi:hypothetical protein
MLDGPGARPLPELRSQSETLAFQIIDLRKRFNADELEVRLSRAANPTETLRLLDFPLWSASQRVKIFDRAAAQGHAMGTEAIAKAAALKSTDPLPTAAAAPVQASEEWRAQLAIDLLRFDSVAGVKPLTELLAKAKSAAAPAEWEALGLAIRKGWPAALTSRFRAIEKPSLEQQKIGYILHPFDEKAIPLPEDGFTRDPAARLRKNETAAMWRWVAETHYQADSEKFATYQNSRPEMAEYSRELDAIGRALGSRKP